MLGGNADGRDALAGTRAGSGRTPRPADGSPGAPRRDLRAGPTSDKDPDPSSSSGHVDRGVPRGGPDEEDAVPARAADDGAGSEVERIVLRLERRNGTRVPVTPDARGRFLRSCRDAQLSLTRCPGSASRWDAGCIRREDVLRMREGARLEVEGRTRTRRVLDGTLAWLGFPCGSKVLLRVLNRAVDAAGGEDGDRADLFDFNDFVFYNLEPVSRYPWMRSAGAFSVLATLAFYLFSPLLWCAVMDDPNVCPMGEDWDGSAGSGWMSSLYFASATMSVSILSCFSR